MKSLDDRRISDNMLVKEGFCVTRSHQIMIGIIAGSFVLFFSLLFPSMLKESYAVGAFVGGAIGSFMNLMLLGRREMKPVAISTISGCLVILAVGSAVVSLLPLAIVPASSAPWLKYVILGGVALVFALISHGKQLFQTK